MPYDPRAIANYFLELAKAQGVEDLTPPKIQKLVYFANGWNLAIRDVPLIDEQVEAWRWGPVIRSLYRAFRQYGNQPVGEPAILFTYEADDSGDFVPCETIPTIDDRPEDAEFTKELLKRVWDVYGKYTPAQLSNLTHQDGSPWHEVYLRYHGEIPRGTDISPELIRDYFVRQARAKATAR